MSSSVAGVVPEYQPRSEQNILRICTSWPDHVERRTDDVDGRTDIFSCFDMRRQILQGVGGAEIGSQRMNTYFLETFEELSEFTLGKIISLYEYKTIIEASLSKVNPFDQFGVALGKELVKKNI